MVGPAVPAPGRLVCVALSPSVDVTYVCQDVRLGAIHRPLEVRRTPGGKGFNAARVAHRLGAKVVTTGIIAGHTGAWVSAGLAEAGVPFLPVAGPGETRACISVADSRAGTLTEVYEPATPVDARSWWELVDVVARLAGPGTAWVALCGALPEGVPAGGLARLLDAAAAGGARVAVDTHGPALAAAVLSGVDLVKVNAAEARELLGGPDGIPEQDLDPLDLARRLLERAPQARLVVITAGAQGAAAIVRGGPALLCRTEVHGGFPVGSGDSFLGGLLTRLCADPGDLSGALRTAVAAGTANAIVPGAGRVDVPTVARLASQALVDAVPVRQR